MENEDEAREAVTPEAEATGETTPEAITLNEQAKQILAAAKEKGAEHNFMFETTFRRYLETINHLVELQALIKEHGMLVSKEYVKGRKNLYVNPAINAYNATAAVADRTAQVLMRYIIEPLPSVGGDDGDEFDNF